MKRFCLFLIVVFGCRFSLFGQVITPEAKERAASLVSRMTLDEKLEYIGGYDGFYIRVVPRLGENLDAGYRCRPFEAFFCDLPIFYF